MWSRSQNLKSTASNKHPRLFPELSIINTYQAIISALETNSYKPFSNHPTIHLAAFCHHFAISTPLSNHRTSISPPLSPFYHHFITILTPSPPSFTVEPHHGTPQPSAIHRARPRRLRDDASVKVRAMGPAALQRASQALLRCRYWLQKAGLRSWCPPPVS